ncbi:MAG: hypothetical protein AVDCRST_MAG19-1045 [uncultured Thermomicrobiales bacterium]|uniref:Uncharacterized protein n=1 Tax=uncultured Thermomicrobiales bacterium TaxID=1645740 RepID=A0A6J4UPA3_9BACT|nr:MAG: hypothetical protein AVDCRST_MAG19-1045 [uncultured Thermomicrobiales bacterium]
MGGALAALLAGGGPEEAGAAAICRQGGQRCDRDRECCSHNCSAQGRCRACENEDSCVDRPCGPENPCWSFPTAEGPQQWGRAACGSAAGFEPGGRDAIRGGR